MTSEATLGWSWASSSRPAVTRVICGRVPKPEKNTIARSATGPGSGAGSNAPTSKRRIPSRSGLRPARTSPTSTAAARGPGLIPTGLRTAMISPLAGSQAAVSSPKKAFPRAASASASVDLPAPLGPTNSAPRPAIPTDEITIVGLEPEGYAGEAKSERGADE